MKYEYKTTFFPLVYDQNSSRFEDVGQPPRRIQVWPEPRPSTELDTQMNEMGTEGWELVSVQPIQRTELENQKSEIPGLMTTGSINTSYRYPVLMGYYFFWKRVIEKYR